MFDFKGYISDFGGFFVNMYKMKGKVQEICDCCVVFFCIYLVVCFNLDMSYKFMIEFYCKVDVYFEVKKVFVGSGICYDLLVDSYNKNNDGSFDEYMEQVVICYISGCLKVVLEYIFDVILWVMCKFLFKYFYEFKKKYDVINKKYGFNQLFIFYFIFSYLGFKEESMVNLVVEIKDMGFKLEQVQDFMFIFMMVVMVIYYIGVYFYIFKLVYIVKSKMEKWQ